MKKKNRIITLYDSDHKILKEIKLNFLNKVILIVLIFSIKKAPTWLNPSIRIPDFWFMSTYVDALLLFYPSQLL